MQCTPVPLPDNELFTIKPVEAVEKYTRVYDNTPQCASQDEQDKAWAARQRRVALQGCAVRTALSLCQVKRHYYVPSSQPGSLRT